MKNNVEPESGFVPDSSYLLGWKEVISALEIGNGLTTLSPIDGIRNGINWKKVYGSYKIEPRNSFIHRVDEAYHVYLALEGEAKIADVYFLQANIIVILQMYPENFSPRHVFKDVDSAAYFLDQLSVPLPIFLPEATSAADYLNAMGIPHIVMGVGRKSYIKVL